MSYSRFNNSLHDSSNQEKAQSSVTVLNFDQDDDNETSVRATLLRESGHITRSEQLIDEQYDIAVKAREDLLHQRAIIRSMQNQYNSVTERFQIVNSVIKKIALRKRKETIILAIVFALALGFLLYNIF